MVVYLQYITDRNQCVKHLVWQNNRMYNEYEPVVIMSLVNSCTSWCYYVIQIVLPHKVLHALIPICYIL
jgi:hypothetical protein